mgnify:CR=1 FL=1
MLRLIIQIYFKTINLLFAYWQLKLQISFLWFFLKSCQKYLNSRSHPKFSFKFIFFFYTFQNWLLWFFILFRNLLSIYHQSQLTINIRDDQFLIYDLLITIEILYNFTFIPYWVIYITLGSIPIFLGTSLLTCNAIKDIPTYGICSNFYSNYTKANRLSWGNKTSKVTLPN